MSDYNFDKATHIFKESICGFPKKTMLHFLAENPMILADITLEHAKRKDKANGVDAAILGGIVTLMSKEDIAIFQKLVTDGIDEDDGSTA